MPGRHGSLSGANYRYKFNGMEADGDVSGEGNSYTTQFRQYDPRLGRWKSLDPLAAQFPWQSPFCGMDNNPISLIDPLGLSTEDSSPTPEQQEKSEQMATSYGEMPIPPDEKSIVYIPKVVTISYDSENKQYKVLESVTSTVSYKSKIVQETVDENVYVSEITTKTTVSTYETIVGENGNIIESKVITDSQYCTVQTYSDYFGNVLSVVYGEYNRVTDFEGTKYLGVLGQTLVQYKDEIGNLPFVFPIKDDYDKFVDIQENGFTDNYEPSDEAYAFANLIPSVQKKIDNFTWLVNKELKSEDEKDGLWGFVVKFYLEALKNYEHPTKN